MNVLQNEIEKLKTKLKEMQSELDTMKNEKLELQSKLKECENEKNEKIRTIEIVSTHIHMCGNWFKFFNKGEIFI